ncbi:DHH family phosphoesterase [Nitratidesulfovibrio termitidis]|uniref:DHH family phosphoesterase n=1 Tax=Nitratidesulfovibrio termitidis TaxID=42252 RepID=UPI0004028AFB|nr:bifunctional oligoribonuclease/PAP phosphatase NrnA [Nitratidesulfovibrio termitidis]
MTDTAASIAAIIRAEDDILVASHANPDGDAIGAVAAMAHVLRALGKRFRLYNTSGVPQQYGWVDMGGPVARTWAELEGFTPRLAVILDCGDAHRVGGDLQARLPELRSVNIDHHLGNPMFGTVGNWVEPHLAATCQMAGMLARELGVPLSGPLGEAVYLGICTDTGNFCYGSTSGELLELAAEIVRLGLKPGLFHDRLENNWSIGRMRLWGALMQGIELHCGGAVAVSVITDDMFALHGADKDDLEGYASQLRRLAGVRVSLMVRGDGAGRSKISLRSSGTDDVRVVAAAFGGGGHRNAAGAELDMQPHEAARAVLAAIPAQLAPCGKEA